MQEADSLFENRPLSLVAGIPHHLRPIDLGAAIRAGRRACMGQRLGGLLLNGCDLSRVSPEIVDPPRPVKLTVKRRRKRARSSPREPARSSWCCAPGSCCPPRPGRRTRRSPVTWPAAYRWCGPGGAGSPSWGYRHCSTGPVPGGRRPTVPARGGSHRGRHASAGPYKWSYDADAEHARCLERHPQPEAVPRPTGNRMTATLSNRAPGRNLRFAALGDYFP